MTNYIRFLGLCVAIFIALFFISDFIILDHYNFSNDNLQQISNVFIILTVLIIPVCLMASYNNIVHGYSMYISLILILEIVLIYLFATTDLIGFYVAFELALLPLYILVGCYGASSNRLRASLLLWSYTMIGSLCLLIGVIYLIVTIGTTDLNLLSIYSLNLYDTRIIWILFAIGLAIKVPSVPFHIWLPRAHVEANVSSSILLAAIILKLSTYGSLVLLLDTLTNATAYYQDLWLWLALVSFLHSSIVTVIQIDSKTLIAYSSVAHMAIITVGLHSSSYVGIVGAILLAIAHASSSSSLFIIFGQIIYDRLHTRTIYYLRNIGSYMPSLRTLLLLAIVANSATPGTINWIAEFYVLIGSTYQNIVVSIVITSTVLLTAVYSFWMYTYVNGNTGNNVLIDCTKIEITTLLYLLIPGFIVGIYPSFIENCLLHDSLVVSLFTPMFGFNLRQKMFKVFKYLSFLIGFIYFVYCLALFFTGVIIPFADKYFVPIIAPYAFYIRLLSIGVISFNLYQLIKNWNNSFDEIKVDDDRPIETYSTDKITVIKVKYRWWVDPLRLILFTLIVVFTAVNWESFKIVFFDHYIIIIIVYFVILFSLLIFSDELLNIQPYKNTKTDLSLSDYSPKAGKFLENYIGTKTEKLIKLVMLLNILITLCFNEYLVNSESLLIFLIYVINRIILAIGLIYAFFIVVIFIYVLVFIAFKSNSKKHSNNIVSKTDVSKSGLSNRRSFSISATSRAGIIGRVLKKTEPVIEIFKRVNVNNNSRTTTAISTRNDKSQTVIKPDTSGATLQVDSTTNPKATEKKSTLLKPSELKILKPEEKILGLKDNMISGNLMPDKNNSGYKTLTTIEPTTLLTRLRKWIMLDVKSKFTLKNAGKFYSLPAYIGAVVCVLALCLSLTGWQDVKVRLQTPTKGMQNFMDSLRMTIPLFIDAFKNDFDYNLWDKAISKGVETLNIAEKELASKELSTGLTKNDIKDGKKQLENLRNQLLDEIGKGTVFNVTRGLSKKMIAIFTQLKEYSSEGSKPLTKETMEKMVNRITELTARITGISPDKLVISPTKSEFEKIEKPIEPTTPTFPLTPVKSEPEFNIEKTKRVEGDSKTTEHLFDFDKHRVEIEAIESEAKAKAVAQAQAEIKAELEAKAEAEALLQAEIKADLEAKAEAEALLQAKIKSQVDEILEQKRVEAATDSLNQIKGSSNNVNDSTRLQESADNADENLQKRLTQLKE